MAIVNTTSLKVTSGSSASPFSPPPSTKFLSSAFDIAEEDAARGDAAVRNAIEGSLSGDPEYQRLKALRSLLRDSPGFKFYRATGNSRLIHASAGQTSCPPRVAQKISLIDSEIARSKTVFCAGQVLFHGTCVGSGSAQIGLSLCSFLSTTLCLPVAAHHALKAGQWNHHTQQFAQTPIIFEIELSRDLTGFFVPTGKLEEYEVLFSRGLTFTSKGMVKSLSNGIQYSQVTLS